VNGHDGWGFPGWIWRLALTAALLALLLRAAWNGDDDE
jgi:hypothetical protein